MKSLITTCYAFAVALSGYSAAPLPTAISLEDFNLVGEFGHGEAAFTLRATARVENPKGGSLDLLCGPVALTEIGATPKWKLQANEDRLTALFERRGKFPMEVKFNASVRQTNGWNMVHFHVAPSTLLPITLTGLPADTEFDFAGAARPKRVGNDFQSYLAADGEVTLSWRAARPEVEGRLFYSAEMLSQISVSPGLLRQTALFDFKVMQGELTRIALVLRGVGEVTRVQGDQVLAWNLERISGSAERKLVVQFNQPQKDQFSLQVQTQTPLASFPVEADPVQLRPEGATRFGGYFRITNDGAVRLEVSQASGLSQISPDQFPETDATCATLRPTGSQRFTYRFSSMDFSMRIQADQIQPELGVSEVLAYRLSENELAIDAELELDIREAPIRDLTLQVPKGYAVAQLTAANLSDYFLTEPAGQDDAELRLVFGTPVAGRQVLQLRLERNQPLGESAWTLPRLAVAKVKSMHGHIAIAADPGYRLTPERTAGLTEIATAFFPRKVAGIQAAFRLSEQAWQATVQVVKLAQTVQVDALHLFSIGEGIAYGSSVLNYVISGAPVSALKVELSDEYYNVEFTGKEVRNWQKTAGGYIVQLHTPISGSYTLLASYERPFRPQGETLTFNGAHPLDAQTEQGHTIIISAYQFEVRPTDVSSGLLALEPGEVPAEYRLFFDAPVLAAYRYNSRPFNLKLALSPLAQGDSLSQVVDRASLVTRISKEGQVITEMRYFVKNRGNPHLRLRLPPGTQLWSAAVNGTPVVPVLDGSSSLIPLPQGSDPNAVLALELKLATRAQNARRLSIATPSVGAPIMLSQWILQPDAGQRLVYRGGSLTPVGGVPDDSGSAQLARLFTSDQAGRARFLLFACFVLLGSTVLVWSWAAGKGVHKFSARHLTGGLLGLCGLALMLVIFGQLVQSADVFKRYAPREVTLLVPIQQADSQLTVEVSNLEERIGAQALLSHSWPACLAIVAFAYGWRRPKSSTRLACRAAGWVLLAWSALRWPQGGTAFLILMAVFILWHAIIPALRQLWRLPRQPETTPPLQSQSGAASAAAAVLISSLVWLDVGTAIHASEPTPASEPRVTVEAGKPTAADPSSLAESVYQEIRVDEGFAVASLKLRWRAEKGETLPLVYEPAVLTQISYPTDALKLVQSFVSREERNDAGTLPARVQQLVAKKRGVFQIDAQYQLPVKHHGSQSGFFIRFNMA